MLFLQLVFSENTTSKTMYSFTNTHLKSVSVCYLPFAMQQWSALCGQNEYASQNVLVCALPFSAVLSLWDSMLWIGLCVVTVSILSTATASTTFPQAIRVGSVVQSWFSPGFSSLGKPQVCFIWNSCEVCVSYWVCTVTHMQFSQCESVQWDAADSIHSFTAVNRVLECGC